ncbi:MAG: hypothetical protein EOP09_19820, partial [Proteobacteria bacterium]
MQNKTNSASGQSLVSVLVSLAITGIVLAVTMQIVSNQNKSLRFFTQKSDVLEMRSSILQSLQIEDSCKWQIVGAGNLINTTSLAAQKLNLNAFYAGVDALSPVLAK